jgi:large subunit ribosomal protein L48
MSLLVRAILRSRPVTSCLPITSCLPFTSCLPVTSCLPASSLHTSTFSRKTFEPDYLETEGVTIPLYPPLNIQLKGYNFDVLEQFQSWVHRLAENMGVDVPSAWATPAQSLVITTFQEGGLRPKDSYNVYLYERNVKVVNLRSVDASTLIDVIQRALPEGVQFSLHEHSVEAEELRWIADPFIDKLRTELSDSQEEMEAGMAKKAIVADAKAAKKKELVLKNLLDE